MDINKYKTLKEKYGKWSSWGLYDPEKNYNYKYIDENIQMLTEKYVFCALNAACPTTGDWEAFHVRYKGSKIWLLEKMFSAKYKGAYLTDIIKGEDTPRAHIIMKKYKENRSLIDKHISFFIEEIIDIGASILPSIYVFGKDARRIFEENKLLSDLKPIYLPHYSDPRNMKYILDFMGKKY